MLYFKKEDNVNNFLKFYLVVVNQYFKLFMCVNNRYFKLYLRVCFVQIKKNRKINS